MYCGNNHNKIGNRNIGTRYDCFRKGVGIGLSLPIDLEYDGEYRPIDERKIYCGKSNILPLGYDILGNSSMCLQKGVGIGKTIKVKKSKRKPKKKSKKKSKRKSRSR